MWIEPVKWLADKLMERHKDKKATQRDRWDRVAVYFDQLASVMEAMLIKFRAKQIPRIEGNQLNELISHFSDIVSSVYSQDDDKDRETVHSMLSELYQTAERALNEDMQHLAYGYFGEKYETKRQDFLEDLERTIGRYRGLAMALKASVPS